MTKSVTNPEELGGLASQMTSDYGHLALQGQMAAATAEPEEVCYLKAPILRSKHTVLPTLKGFSVAWLHSKRPQPSSQNQILFPLSAANFSPPTHTHSYLEAPGCAPGSCSF